MTNLRDNSQIPLFLCSALCWLPQNEVWKPIAGYEGLYEVSNYGRIKSLSKKVNAWYGLRSVRGRIKSPDNHADGYSYASLNMFGKSTTFRLHRLVAMAFIVNPDSKPQVNHKNGIKSDNRVCNLEWCTGSENLLHAFRTGLSKTNSNRKGKLGADHNKSKCVQMFDLHGNYLKTFGSAMEAQRGTGISQGNISNICRGTTKKPRSFIFKYA